MMNNFINQIKMVFASPEKRLAHQTQILALETVDSFNGLQRTIKDGEYVIEDHRKITQDREQFMRDNADTQVDQNVNRNTDTKRAMWILMGVMLIGTVFSVKGLQFFFGEFYASVSLWAIIPIAIALAAVLVIGSIGLNHFSEQYRGKNTMVFIHAKAAAYLIVLFLPLVNLIEGYNSHYSETVMALNILAVLVDITAHTALVSMHNTFITAENSKNAIKILKQKDKAQRNADMDLRSLNDAFIKGKNAFSKKATQFVHSYKQLEEQNAQAARQAMFMLSNFLVWMINNKVMQHRILPYHANENGSPEVEMNYFTPENDAVRKGWDQLSTVNGYNNAQQSAELLNNTQQPESIANGNGQQQQEQPQPEVNNANAENHNPEPEINQEQPQGYDQVVDETNPNPNDKIL